jgi:hypothetical protein
MPKAISKEEIDELIELLEKFPEGISIQDILNMPNMMGTQRRSLQRRLALLIKLGRIVVVGESRARRHKLPQDKNTDEIKKEYKIPLSTESENIQKLIIQPIQARTPIGYNRKFLDKYCPNVTSYLPESISKKFFELAKTDGNNPAGTYAREILIDS